MGRERDSGTNKVGSFVGAHVKTGIGSLLPTGQISRDSSARRSIACEPVTASQPSGAT